MRREKRLFKQFRSGAGLWLGLVMLVSGCSTTATSVTKTVAQVAEEDYKAAMGDLQAGNYTEAMLTFQKVSKAPRYVRWSALAKLRIADSLFFSGKYQEAGQNTKGSCCSTRVTERGTRPVWTRHVSVMIPWICGYCRHP